MKDFAGKIQWKDHEYRMVFNLNVMERIQEEYGTIDKWARASDGTAGEPNAKAVIFGIKEMINEAIDMDNDDNGTSVPPLTHKQVGRIITDMGLLNATAAMNDVVIESTKSEDSDSKNG